MSDENLTLHFTKAEMACKCGCGAVAMKSFFMQKLQALRVEYGRQMVITSGFRCNNYNMKIKGAVNSFHLRGMAIDVSLVDAGERRKLIALALPMGFSVGADKAFLHLDLREDPIFFLY